MSGIRLFAVLAGTLVALAAPVPGSAAPEGKVVIAQGVDPSTLDTMNQQETPASVVGEHIYNKLVERDQTLKIVPALAAEMPKLVSPQVWEVKLRKGVKFHNGEDFNADSVKFSLERAKDPEDARQLELQADPAGGDRGSLHGHASTPCKPWPIVHRRDEPARRRSMYPPKAYADKDSPYISKNPIGTGPYKFVRWSKDEEIVLEANESYCRGAAKIKTVVFSPSPTTPCAWPRSRTARWTSPSTSRRTWRTSSPITRSSSSARRPASGPSSSCSTRTQFDTQNKLVGPYQGPTADKRVRQAIALALDVDEIIKGVLDGKAQRVATMLPEHALRLRSFAQARQAGPGQDQEAPGRGGLPQRARDHAQRPRRAATCATRKWLRPSPAS